MQMGHRPEIFSSVAQNPEQDVVGAAVTTGTVIVGETCQYMSENPEVLTQSFSRRRFGRRARPSRTGRPG